MERKIIATNIDGFLIKHIAFEEPHKDWFKRAIEKTGDESLTEWIGKPDYFKGVDVAMAKLMPKASQDDRRKQAREWYQEDVVNYVRTHPEVVNKDVSEFLRSLKEKNTLILITTTAQDYILKILKAVGLLDIYDKIFGTDIKLVPSKEDVFNKAISEIGKPSVYIGGRVKETYELCKKLEIKTIYANFEGFEKIEGIETVDSLVQLKEKII